MKKFTLKNDTVNKSDMNKVFIFTIYPRDSKLHSDKGFVKIDNGSQGGTHWNYFHIGDNKPF